jgi:hypothetical protein
MARNTHKRLARHPGIWRVDGVGPVENRGRLGTRTVVYFSGLTEEGQENPYWKSSLNGETLALPIHSASLRDFKVGSIWREGKRIGGSDQIKTEFHVDVSQLRLVALDQAIDLNGSWASTVVPDAKFCFGDNRSYLTHTLYVIAPVLGDRLTQWIVIPASELLRFYFGVSSRFLSGTLQGRLENYVDWARSRMENGLPVLHLKQSLNRKEAGILAWAISSESAMAALKSAHQYLSSTHANNCIVDENNKRPLVIKVSFPFSDETRLRVCGKRMPIAHKANTEQWAVFVMEILFCAHPLGFSGVILESDDPFERGGLEGADGGSQPPRFSPLLDDEDEDDYEVDDLPADKRLPRLVVRSFTNQFGGFDRLEFVHRRPLGNNGANRQGTNVDIPVDTLATGDGSYDADSKGNLGISEFQNRVEQIDRDLSLFLEMLEHLRKATKERQWQIETRRPQSGGLLQGKEHISLFPEKIGKRRSWHMVVESNGNTRPRQVVWVEVTLGTDGRLFYLLEMELKPGESGQCTIMVHTNNFTKLEDETFRELLILTAIQNRWIDRHNKWKETRHYIRAKALFEIIQLHRIHHPPVPHSKQNEKIRPALNPKAWSAALLEEIEELIRA